MYSIIHNIFINRYTSYAVGDKPFEHHYPLFAGPKPGRLARPTRSTPVVVSDVVESHPVDLDRHLLSRPKGLGCNNFGMIRSASFSSAAATRESGNSWKGFIHTRSAWHRPPFWREGSRSGVDRLQKIIEKQKKIRVYIVVSEMLVRENRTEQNEGSQPWCFQGELQHRNQNAKVAGLELKKGARLLATKPGTL